MYRNLLPHSAFKGLTQGDPHMHFDSLRGSSGGTNYYGASDEFRTNYGMPVGKEAAMPNPGPPQFRLVGR
jgi:hypothetical protein